MIVSVGFFPTYEIRKFQTYLNDPQKDDSGRNAHEIDEFRVRSFWSFVTIKNLKSISFVWLRKDWKTCFYNLRVGKRVTHIQISFPRYCSTSRSSSNETTWWSRTERRTLWTLRYQIWKISHFTSRIFIIDENLSFEEIVSSCDVSEIRVRRRLTFPKSFRYENEIADVSSKSDLLLNQESILRISFNIFPIQFFFTKSNSSYQSI